MKLRSPLLPHWARRRVVLALGLIMVTAVALRIPVRESLDDTAPLSDQYGPIAAAIGLTHDIPQGEVLATYVNAPLYAFYYQALAVISPGTSHLDFYARFLSDPQGFAALASYAALAASVISVLLLWILVRRLLDPICAFAAAFLLAIHPSAALERGAYASEAFALLLLLAGLLVASEITRRKLNHVDFVAIGLCLGFAADAFPAAAFPAAAIALALLGLFALHHLRRDRRPRPLSITIGIICFTAASLTVAPSIWHPAALYSLVVIGAIATLAIITLFWTIRHLRETLDPQIYSCAVLSVTVLFGAGAVGDLKSCPGEGTPPASVAASQWLVENLPHDSLIVVHPTLSQKINLPRNARSWKRELHSGVPASYPQNYLLAAAHAASNPSGPAWDVLVSADPVGTVLQKADAHGPPSAPRFIVLPDIHRPDEHSFAEFWLVARFRSHDPSCEGVSVWGAPDPEHRTEPVHVHWLMRDAGRLASAPAPLAG